MNGKKNSSKNIKIVTKIKPKNYKILKGKPIEKNIAIIGSGGVGKSSIAIRFCQSMYFDELDPTIEDTYKKMINVGDDLVLFNIFDEAGLK